MKDYHFNQHKGFAVYFRLLLFIRQFWFRFVIALVGTMLAGMATASFTWLLKPILDKGFIERDVPFIHWIPYLLVMLCLFRGIANYIGDYYMSWVGRQIITRFRQEIFKHLLKMPAAFYDKTTGAYLLSAIIYNVDQLANASTSALTSILQEGFFLIGLFVVMFTISWQLSLIYLIALPLIALTARYASKRMRHLSHNLQENMGEITQIAREAIDGYQTVRIFGGSEYEAKKFFHSTENNKIRELKITATNSLAGGLVQQAAGLAIAIIIGIAASHHIHITAGGFASLLTAMLALLKPLKNLSNVSSTIQKGIAAAESAFQLLDEPLEADKGKKVLQEVNGELSFHSVSFQYSKKTQKILSNLNFHIPAGKVTAVVGRSGAGKSTLIKLIPHFYDHYEGEIFLDGINLRDIELKNLREQIALVSQHVTLFNDTIANNIAYGGMMANASMEDIINAAKTAYAHEFIMGLPQQYETVIGDQGSLLSGGQRQRIAIARAILKDAPILILDEATSALDNQSEFYIQQALVELTKNRTTIVIAHRLSTVENADQIIVLSEGEIVEQGKHADLLKLNQEYSKLYRGEFKA